MKETLGMTRGDWLNLRRDILTTPKGYYQFYGWVEGSGFLLRRFGEDYFVPKGGLLYSAKADQPKEPHFLKAYDKHKKRALGLTEKELESEKKRLRALHYSRQIL